MSNLIPGNQKNLTLDDRKFIEDSLNEGLSFKEIAKYLCQGSDHHLKGDSSSPG